MQEEGGSLKGAVARTLKWNVIDRVSTQILYAVTGIVLANTLSHEDYGLVGAITVFQAFAQMFIDSGFTSALLQRKNPSHLDYSTVLWFNLSMAGALYLLLFACAPLIADFFQGDDRIIGLSRVLFLSFIINAAGIVQTNIRMKQMDVRIVAIANSAALFSGSLAGIVLALLGYGAWAIVWQTIILAAVRTAILWLSSSWRPLLRFSWQVLRGFFSVGSGVMLTSLFTTLFQNIYPMLIGNRSGLVQLGYFAQADKWSKMGVMSISQTLTSSFLPLLSQVQDQRDRYAAICCKTHRLTAYLVIPAMCLLTLMATDIFHTLFGEKWDPSVPLFQILCLRGIFVVLGLQYSNYILSLGRSKLLVVSEIVRDGSALLIMVPTFGLLSEGMAGLAEFMIWQTVASVISWAVLLVMVSRLTGRRIGAWIADLLPYSALTLLSSLPCLWVEGLMLPPFTACIAIAAAFAAVYLGACWLSGSKIQRDAVAYVCGRLK